MFLEFWISGPRRRRITEKEKEKYLKKENIWSAEEKKTEKEKEENI